MKYFWLIALIYYAAVNMIAFILYYADKLKAVKHRWRISETALLTVSFAGGCIGAFAAMKLFRHKTKHPKFCILVPMSIVLHAAVWGYVIFKANFLH
ncbi:MAG: DUF1294 domain-containing protein [Clostridium sp.]|nr:DUF1294 domain-containing protein [Clostridium sp.]MCM1547033.1 DUF1294 domain-containing protein [Ruminococcus sp.]